MKQTRITTDNVVRNCKRKERKRDKDRKRFHNAIESSQQHIKNTSNQQLTDKQIIPGIKVQSLQPDKRNLLLGASCLRILINLLDKCAYNTCIAGREMNLIPSMSSQTGYHPTSFPGSLILTPGASEEKGRGEALGTRLGTTSPTFRDLRNLSTRSQIRACRTPQARDNLSHNERRALKELSRDKLKNIVLKKADKGTPQAL